MSKVCSDHFPNVKFEFSCSIFPFSILAFALSVIFKCIFIPVMFLTYFLTIIIKVTNNSDPQLAFAINSLTLQSLGNVKLCPLNFLIFYPKLALLPNWSPQLHWLQFSVHPRTGQGAEGLLHVEMAQSCPFSKSGWECHGDKVFICSCFSSVLHKQRGSIIVERRTCNDTSGCSGG